MRSSGIWVIVALVIGLGVGYGFGRGQTPSPEERPLSVGPGTAEEAAAPTEAKLLGAEAPHPAESAALRQPTLEIPTGNGAIGGRVLDGADKPIAGVLMIAVPMSVGPRDLPPPGGGAPAAKSLEDKLAQAASRVRLMHAGRREAQTDGSGQYQIEGLAAGGYRIQAYREGYKLKAARGSRAWGAEPGASVDFVGEGVVVVPVDVLNPDGTHPKQASLQTSTDAEGRRGRHSFTWSPERAFIEIPPGTHWLTATAGKDRDLKAPAQEFAAAFGAEPPRLTVRLVGRPGIRGRVSFPEVLTSMRFSMKALRFSGDTAPEAAAVLQSRAASRVRYDRRDERYSVQDVEPGRYLLVASYDGHRPDLTRVVDVASMMVDLDLEMPPVDRGYYRIVRVLDEKNEPVPRVQFSVKIDGPRMSSSGPASSLQREDGSYYVSYRIGKGRRSVAEPGEGATVSLTISTRERGALERVIDPKDKGDLLIHFGGAASLDLTIEGFAESGLTGKSVVYMKTALEQSAIGFSGEGIPVTAEGRVHVPKQQSGEQMAVLVYREGYTTIQVKVFRLRLGAGENRLTVRLPRLHDVTVEGVKRGVALKCLDAKDPWVHQYGRSVTDGAVILRFVPPGRYEASVSMGDGGRKKIEFDVPAQTVIRLD